MKWIVRFLTRCAFRHQGDVLKDFDAEGRLILRCRECCQVIEAVLPDLEKRYTPMVEPQEPFESAAERVRARIAMEQEQRRFQRPA